jgi:hypothetical protein
MQFETDCARKRSQNLHETYQLPCVQWITPDDGHRRCPKHVEFYDKTKFRISDASSWLFYTKHVTMHGHLNTMQCTVFTSLLPYDVYAWWLRQTARVFTVSASLRLKRRLMHKPVCLVFTVRYHVKPRRTGPIWRHILSFIGHDFLITSKTNSMLVSLHELTNADIWPYTIFSLT